MNGGNSRRGKGQLFKAGGALLIGTEMVAAIVIGILIGYYLDEKLDTAPLFTIAFFLIGVAAAFRLLFQRARMLK